MAITDAEPRPEYALRLWRSLLCLGAADVIPPINSDTTQTLESGLNLRLLATIYEGGPVEVHFAFDIGTLVTVFVVKGVWFTVAHRTPLPHCQQNLRRRDYFHLG